jgi:hypothetical protein
VSLPRTIRGCRIPTAIVKAAKTKGNSHDHRTLCISAEPARLQADGGREPSRPRLRAARRRPQQGRAEGAGLRRAQSQHAHADPQGRRLRDLGIQRHHPVSRLEEARQRPAAPGRKGQARRDAMAVLGSRPLGPGRCGFRVRIPGETRSARHQGNGCGRARQGNRGAVEPYGEIKRWYATLGALPSWQKTLAQCTSRRSASAA